MIVDRSAHLSHTIPSLVKGGYYHAGQVCVSVQRIFVHQEIVSSFMDGFIKQIKKLRVGDPQLKETDVDLLFIHVKQIGFFHGSMKQ